MPISGKGKVPFIAAAFLLASIAASFGAPPPIPQKNTAIDSTINAADTSKVIVTEDYWEGSEKKSALFDSSGRQLSAQQMVDFLQNELRKLNEQVNAIVQKSSPDSGNDSGANDVDVMKLFIIKGKLESMEKMLDEWTKQRTLEASPPEKNPAPAQPPRGK